MSTTNVISELQTINAAITGVTTAPTTMPVSLITELLPCVLVHVGPGTLTKKAMAFQRHDYILEVKFYVLPIGQGEGLEGNATCQTLLDAALAKYFTQLKPGSGVPLNSAVASLGNIEHTGVLPRPGELPLTYGNVDYWGFQFDIAVWEK